MGNVNVNGNSSSPQVPAAVPLQRHDEMHVIVPTHSSSQTTPGYPDIYNENKVPTMITWSYGGGQQVYVQGSWDNWSSRTALQKSGKDFTILKVLASGVYHYRFIVDGIGCYDPELPWSKDEAGNACNILDLQDYVPEDIGSISGFEPPQSPTSSYDNLPFSSEDCAKEPPLVPPQLATTPLNVRTANVEIQPTKPRPQHSVLNHFYIPKGESSPSVVSLGSTNRFLSKYVTVVLYKSVQR